jgi:hypothetical protein
MMNALNFFIHVPLISWLFVLLILGLFVWACRALLLKEKEVNAYTEIINVALSDIEKQYSVGGLKGINASAIEQITMVIEKSILLKSWQAFQKTLIYRKIHSDSDDEVVWRTNSAEEYITETSFLSYEFNQKLIHAIPGILTGVGLLGTFVAILIGLSHLSIVDNKVSGLEGLIGGLSGKFFSSVISLSLATIYIFIEKRIFHRLSSIRRNFIFRIDRLIPYRTASHQLEEICENLIEQSAGFRTFNSDFSSKLRNSFSESMNPLIEQMVKAISEMNEATRTTQGTLLETLNDINQKLSKSEASHNESMSNQLGNLMAEMKESLDLSFSNMSKEFSKSLTGSTQDQFEKVAQSVGATADILESVTQRFDATQIALQDMLVLAKQSTENQFDNSSKMIERMVNLIGTSLGQMEEKMGTLSSQMATTIQDTSQKSSESAGNVIAEVRTLNEHSAQKFMEVLKKHESQLDASQELKFGLQEAVSEFGKYVTGYNQINNGLQTISKEVFSAMGLLSQSSQKLKEGQESFNKVAEFARTQIESFTTSQDNQKEVWQRINSSMEEYSTTFKNVEESTGKILEQISKNLISFTHTTQDHFEKTTSVANNHVNDAVGKLSSSIGELQEKLDDLTEILDKAIPAKAFA